MTVIKEIEKSPIYNMSMCSLENFHTCFLYWLGKTYPNIMLRVFKPKVQIDKIKEIKFENQKKVGKCIFDLYITMKMENEEQNSIVIENKLKSFPTKEQLKKYSDSLKNKTEFILLTLIPLGKDTIELPEKWSCLSYSVLAKELQDEFNKAELISDYHKSIITDYISVIRTLSDNLNNTISETYDIYDKVENVFDDLKDIYIKYRTSQLCNYLYNEIKKQNINYNVIWSFSNKQGIVDVVYNLDINGYEIKFLIQIQKFQYRYCMVFGNEDENELRESVASRLANDGVLFNDCEKTNNTKNYKEFCGYKPNFIYRYKKIESSLSYKEILHLIINDMKNLEDKRQKIIEIISSEIKKIKDEYHN